jgi:hypothetical protein
LRQNNFRPEFHIIIICIKKYHFRTAAPSFAGQAGSKNAFNP